MPTYKVSLYQALDHTNFLLLWIDGNLCLRALCAALGYRNPAAEYKRALTAWGVADHLQCHGKACDVPGMVAALHTAALPHRSTSTIYTITLEGLHKLCTTQRLRRRRALTRHLYDWLRPARPAAAASKPRPAKPTTPPPAPTRPAPPRPAQPKPTTPPLQVVTMPPTQAALPGIATTHQIAHAQLQLLQQILAELQTLNTAIRTAQGVQTYTMDQVH